VTLERDFAKQVEMILDFRGWLWKHDEPARRPSGGWATAFRGTRGFPDYIAVRGDRVVLAEIKSERGRASEDQQTWLTALEQSGRVEVYLWRPSDLQAIAEILR
jgi:hypothetical protein